MRLDDDGNKHDLGSFQMLDVTEEEKSEPIQPDSIEGDSTVDLDMTEQGFKTAWISARAQRALYSLAVIIGLLIGVDVAISIYEFWQIHWMLGAVLLLAVSALVYLSVRAVYHWVKGKNGVELVHELQYRADEVKAGKAQSFETRQLLDDLKGYYLNTPQETKFVALVDDLPDYLNDQERLEQFEQRFLTPIDHDVEAIIQRYSIQTAISVSVSPIPALDALLTLWRNAMMVNEIAATYGVKPTLVNRLSVLASVGRNVAYSGLSQVAIDSFFDLSNVPLAGKLLSSVAQGIGAGVATARVGLYCASVCRPIRIDDGNSLTSKCLQSMAVVIGSKVIKARSGAAAI